MLFKFTKVRPIKHKLCGIRFFGMMGDKIFENGECYRGSPYEYDVKEGERIIGVASHEYSGG